jgi:hypothetical protein
MESKDTELAASMPDPATAGTPDDRGIKQSFETESSMSIRVNIKTRRDPCTQLARVEKFDELIELTNNKLMTIS